MRIQYVLTHTRNGRPDHVGMKLIGKDAAGGTVTRSFGGSPSGKMVQTPNRRVDNQMEYNVLAEHELTQNEIRRLNAYLPGIFNSANRVRHDLR